MSTFDTMREQVEDMLSEQGKPGYKHRDYVLENVVMGFVHHKDAHVADDFEKLVNAQGNFAITKDSNRLEKLTELGKAEEAMRTHLAFLPEREQDQFFEVMNHMSQLIASQRDFSELNIFEQNVTNRDETEPSKSFADVLHQFEERQNEIASGEIDMDSVEITSPERVAEKAIV